jgi:hypothetical protein
VGVVSFLFLSFQVRGGGFGAAVAELGSFGVGFPKSTRGETQHQEPTLKSTHTFYFVVEIVKTGRRKKTPGAKNKHSPQKREMLTKSSIIEYEKEMGARNIQLRRRFNAAQKKSHERATGGLRGGAFSARPGRKPGKHLGLLKSRVGDGQRKLTYMANNETHVLGIQHEDNTPSNNDIVIGFEEENGQHFFKYKYPANYPNGGNNNDHEWIRYHYKPLVWEEEEDGPDGAAFQNMLNPNDPNDEDKKNANILNDLMVHVHRDLAQKELKKRRKGQVGKSHNPFRRDCSEALAEGYQKTDKKGNSRCYFRMINNHDERGARIDHVKTLLIREMTKANEVEKTEAVADIFAKLLPKNNVTEAVRKDQVSTLLKFLDVDDAPSQEDRAKITNLFPALASIGLPADLAQLDEDGKKEAVADIFAKLLPKNNVTEAVRKDQINTLLKFLDVDDAAPLPEDRTKITNLFPTLASIGLPPDLAAARVDAIPMDGDGMNWLGDVGMGNPYDL